MSTQDKEHGEHGPIVITDKREQKRQEAAERARQKAEETQHPAGTGVVEGEPLETVDETLARIDRIQQLQEKGREGELTEEEGGELLQLQVAEEEARQEAALGEGETVSALTAFLVIVGHDGSARATSDVNSNLLIDREANVDDMFTGASIVVRDINAATTSKHVVFGLNVSAAAMAEKQQALQMAQRLQGGAAPGGRRR